MSSNLNRLSKTFRRPILGIHNPSFGIPFDVLECMIQRTFAYPTLDIRLAYTTISAILADESIKKLGLVAHSQGAIEAGMVLDWLYATIPMKQLAKLEIFTFGNAANHWNGPMNDDGPVIEHIEHYANDGDWVARFGVLHFRQSHDITTEEDATDGDATASGSSATRQVQRPQTSVQLPDGLKKKSTWDLERKRRRKDRFFGRMFKRGDCSGHQLNQHYLDNLFVMDDKLERVLDGDEIQTRPAHAMGGRKQAIKSFMEMEVDPDMLERDNTVIAATLDIKQRGAAKNRVHPQSEGPNEAKRFKVKELSRLWLYRNGRTPEDWVHHGRQTW